MSTSSYSPAMNPVVANNGDGRKRKATSTDTLTHDQVNNSNDGGSGSSSLCCPCFHCQCGCHNNHAMAMAMEMMDYDLDSLPTGYRFIPTDKELIRDYLMRKIMNKNLPKNKINEVYIYGDRHPKDIVENYPQAIEGEWYFFTSRNRKYKNGKRPSRSAGLGYWKATGPDKDIEDNGTKIGGKKSLVYYEGHQPNGTKTDWMMQEYVVEGYERQRFGLVDMKLDDYVLCKIYINKKGRKELKDEVLNNVAVQHLRNLDVATHHVRKNLRVPDSIGEVETGVGEVKGHFTVPDQKAHVVPYQDTNHTNYQIENNAIVQHSNFGIHHHVDNNFPNQGMNPDVDDGVVLAYNQQAPPTILQVENNVVVQNYQNFGSFYGHMTPYTMPTHPVQMMNFPRLTGPSEHHSSLTRSNHIYPYLPSTPRKSAPPPPRIENDQHHEHGHLAMYSLGPNLNPPETDPVAFQKGNDGDRLDTFSEYIELMIAQDGNLLLDDPYGILSDAHEQLDSAYESNKHEAPAAEDIDESKKNEAPKVEDSGNCGHQ